jgi:hypothetical protein
MEVIEGSLQFREWDREVHLWTIADKVHWARLV